MKFFAKGLLPLLLVGMTSALWADEKKTTIEQTDFFQKKVRPILADNCFDCHSADTKISGGLRLDSHEGLLKGGDTGAAIVAGNPEKSLLIQRLHLADTKRRMPKNSDPLTDDEIATLTTWV